MIKSDIIVHLCPTCGVNPTPVGFTCSECWANFLLEDGFNPIVLEGDDWRAIDDSVPYLVRGDEHLYDTDDYTGRNVDG